MALTACCFLHRFPDSKDFQIATSISAKIKQHKTSQGRLESVLQQHAGTDFLSPPLSAEHAHVSRTQMTDEMLIVV